MPHESPATVRKLTVRYRDRPAIDAMSPEPARRAHRPMPVVIVWLVRAALLACLGSIFFGAPAAFVVPLTVAVFSGMNRTLRRQIMGRRQ